MGFTGKEQQLLLMAKVNIHNAYQSPVSNGQNVMQLQPQFILTEVPNNANIYKNAIDYPQTLYRERQDIKKWREAIQSAESVERPNRYRLLQIYNDVVLDAHLSSLIEARMNAILASEFTVTKNGIVDEAKTQFLKNKWFYDFIKYSLESKYYGFSLIQFGWDANRNVFNDLNVVPRQYVKPEYGIVCDVWAEEGVSYLSGKYEDWTLGIGDRFDLGLLLKACPLVLWKKGAQATWSEYIQVLGLPIRIGKTESRNPADRDRMAQMLKNIGSSAWGVFDLSDEIQLVENKTIAPHEIFDKMIERCNSELSKLILNQTSTSDQKSYVGSSEVHERVMFQVNEADLIFIENIFTYQLVPFLIQHGYDFAGCRIEAKVDDKLSLKEKGEFIAKILASKMVKIEPSYFEKTFGVPVINVEEQKDDTDITNRLKDYYGG